jgi:spermidine dehydrogenase
MNGIHRRDFLNGAALTLGAALLPPDLLAEALKGPDPTSVSPLLAAGLTPNDPRYYPPALTGMRGSHPGSYETAHQLREGPYHADRVKPDETCDLVVVGGGISGLAAAYFYRRERGPKAKILVLDNHDDFGGHAKRNEFDVGGRTLLACAGTSAIQNWPSYPDAARELFRELGIDVARFKDYYTLDFFKKWDLVRGVFLDKDTFGTDALMGAEGQPDWEQYVAKLPFSGQARADMLRLHTGRDDCMPGLTAEEKVARLYKMSYRTFLLEHLKADPMVAAYYQATFHPIFGVGTDAVEAGLCIPANQEKALGITLPARIDSGEQYPFPDGNATIARMIVRSLIPDSCPGTTMEDIVAARMKYDALDRPAHPVRVRLNSTVMNVTHVGDVSKSRAVEVTYVTAGTPRKVRARGCVMACWNTVVPYLCPEMPAKQKEALAYGVKCAIVFTQLALRNWKAMHKLGVRAVYAPGSYYTSVRMNHPVTIGGYRFPTSPDEPMALLMIHVPKVPGGSQREQRRAAQRQILATPFETFERHAYDQLDRMFGAGGFDSRRDVAAITVNRWTHGYAYEYSAMWDPEWPEAERPYVVGRQPFGRITIANSDARGKSQTWAAIGEAHRAVGELIDQ